MIQRDLMRWGLRVIVLFLCILFRVLLGGDTDDSDNEARFDQKENKVFESSELIKDVTFEFTLNENIVCVP